METIMTQPKEKEIFLNWAHKQKKLPPNIPLANKESLRIALHLIQQDREVAEPTRSTMQKINRFFWIKNNRKLSIKQRLWV